VGGAAHLFDFGTGGWSGSATFSLSECTAAGGSQETHGVKQMCCFFEDGDDIGVQKAKAPNDSGVLSFLRDSDGPMPGGSVAQLAAGFATTF